MLVQGVSEVNGSQEGVIFVEANKVKLSLLDKCKQLLLSKNFYESKALERQPKVQS